MPVSRSARVLLMLLIGGLHGCGIERLESMTPGASARLLAIALEPEGARVAPGMGQQFTVVPTWSDGSETIPQITFSASGGTIDSTGYFVADSGVVAAVVHAQTLDQSLADSTAVFIQPPMGPGLLPEGYDPGRLGDSLLVGDAWQELNVSQGVSAANLPVSGCFSGAAPGQVVAEPDPVFGRVIRFTQPASANATFPATIECRKRFPAPVMNFWYRAVIRLDGNGNPKGFTSSGTGAPGGSSTWKVLFAFPLGDKSRMDLELLADETLHVRAGQYPDNTVIETPLPQGGAPVAPVKGGRLPLKASAGVGSDLLRSKEWFELAMNFEAISSTEYIQRFFIRQLTIDGGRTWAPRAYPTWIGMHESVTSGTIVPYYRIHLGGNKSQTNDGPHDQFVRWGPWEVTTARDPYGWDRYGK
jgi:hypothetical protein